MSWFVVSVLTWMVALFVLGGLTAYFIGLLLEAPAEADAVAAEQVGEQA